MGSCSRTLGLGSANRKCRQIVERHRNDQQNNDLQAFCLQRHGKDTDVVPYLPPQHLFNLSLLQLLIPSCAPLNLEVVIAFCHGHNASAFLLAFSIYIPVLKSTNRFFIKLSSNISFEQVKYSLMSNNSLGPKSNPPLMQFSTSCD